MADVLTVANEMHGSVTGLVGAVRSYRELSEEDQRSVRHLVYQRCGQYGKIIVGTFPAIGETIDALKEEK